MAPNGQVLDHSKDDFNNLPQPWSPRPAAISTEGLHRSFSDVLSFEEAMNCTKLPPLPITSEVVEDAKCECCGMSEEFTAEYVRSVREKFAGRWICGLCSEAVKEEAEKNGGARRLSEALEAHMSECVRFNRIERTQPVLFQTEAMKKILRKSCNTRAKSSNGRERECVKTGGITRSSSSCI